MNLTPFFFQLKDTGARGINAPNLAAPDEPTRALTPADVGHPDHAMHQQIRGKVAQLDTTSGRASDATSERITASLLTLAKDNGLTRVDHVLLSDKTKDLPAARRCLSCKAIRRIPQCCALICQRPKPRSGLFKTASRNWNLSTSN